MFKVILFIFIFHFSSSSISMAQTEAKLTKHAELPSGNIVFEKGLISVDLWNTPLSKVFKALEAEGKIKIIGGEEFMGNVSSVSFKNLTIDRGIARLLSGLNFSLIWGENGSITEVIILGKSESKKPYVQNDESPEITVDNSKQEIFGVSDKVSVNEEESKDKPEIVASGRPVDISKMQKPPSTIDLNDPGISRILKKMIQD